MHRPVLASFPWPGAHRHCKLSVAPAPRAVAHVFWPLGHGVQPPIATALPLYVLGGHKLHAACPLLINAEPSLLTCAKLPGEQSVQEIPPVSLSI